MEPDAWDKERRRGKGGAIEGLSETTRSFISNEIRSSGGHMKSRICRKRSERIIGNPEINALCADKA